MNSISANLNIMIKATEKASKILIRDFGEIEKLQVSKKGPTDFVTNSDLKAEKIIIDELKKAKPHYSIISEENGIENNKDKNNTWIIDPIDGTINYLHGVPHFAISIALKSYDQIIAGLIYDPIKDEMFYAEKNNGTYLNNQRIKVSKRNKIEDCLFVVGNKIDHDNELNVRKSGCAALDMAYVAAGRYDGDDLFMKYRWALDKPFTPEFGKLSNMTIAFDLSGGLEYNDGSGGDGSCNANSLMPGPITISNTFK
mgnify:CR=1 FL=1